MGKFVVNRKKIGSSHQIVLFKDAANAKTLNLAILENGSYILVQPYPDDSEQARFDYKNLESYYDIVYFMRNIKR